MKVVIRTCPQQFIRADQYGDWHYDYNNEFVILVTDQCTSPASQLAVAIHELVEAFLCKHAGIPDEEVVKFDEKYEDERKEGKHSERDEPGDDPSSPYRQEHMAATHVERAVCLALGITWEQHENGLNFECPPV